MLALLPLLEGDSVKATGKATVCGRVAGPCASDSGVEYLAGLPQVRALSMVKSAEKAEKSAEKSAKKAKKDKTPKKAAENGVEEEPLVVDAAEVHWRSVLSLCAWLTGVAALCCR